MNKFIVFLLCALFFGSCNEEEDSIYYPLDNVDIIKGGSEEPTGNATLMQRVITWNRMCWIRLPCILMTRPSVN